MTRNVMLLVVIATISVLILAGVSKVLDAHDKAELRATGDSLRLHIAGTNVERDQLRNDSIVNAAWRDSVKILTDSLRSDLNEADEAAPAIVQARDSARATIQPGDLSPRALNMILLERRVAESTLNRYTLEHSLRLNLEARSVIDSTELAQVRALIATVTGERDTAMSLVARHEARLDFNLWRFLGDEIPQLLACGGGGAVVAELYEGKVLVGAGIGVAACLVKEAIF